MKTNFAAKNIQLAVLITQGAANLIANSAHADPKYLLYKRYLQRQADAAAEVTAPGIGPMMSLFGGLFAEAPPPAPTPGPQPGIFNQKIDHGNTAADAATFAQRYTIDADYASGPRSPVLYSICGEAACTPTAPKPGAPLSAEYAWAKEHGAYIVTLEHRFYGKSQPFTSLALANLKFLSTDQALQDLAAFEDFAKTNLGLTGTWVAVGGSYSGSLAAYYRSRYPNEVPGALSSSGPVMAKASFQEYDLDVATVAGPACAAQMRAAVKEIETGLDNPATTAATKALFDAADVNDNVDFLYVVADMGATPVQYGFKDQFCNAIVGAADPMQAYATAGKAVFKLFGMTALQDTPQFAMDENPADYPDIGMRSWTYQTCVEYGYFQDAYADPAVSVRSARINAAYDAGVCQRLFQMNGPDIAGTNAALYQPLLDPAKTSAILYTNGSTDPWSKLGITAENGNVTNPNTAAYLIDGGSHCSDLGLVQGTDSASLSQARAEFDGLLSKWWP